MSHPRNDCLWQDKILHVDSLPGPPSAEVLCKKVTDIPLDVEEVERSTPLLSQSLRRRWRRLTNIYNKGASEIRRHMSHVA